MSRRNKERDMFIYNARKNDHRAFTDIAKELGLSAARIGQLYRRIDWEINRMNSDHYKQKSFRDGRF